MNPILVPCLRGAAYARCVAQQDLLRAISRMAAIGIALVLLWLAS